MRKGMLKSLSVIFALVFVMLLTSCGDLIDSVVSRLEELETAETIQTEKETDKETEKQENDIPFSYAPELVPYTLPSETFSDPIEEEASGDSYIILFLMMKIEKNSQNMNSLYIEIFEI